MNNKVLITGGQGFLGSNLVAYLSEKKRSNIVIFDTLINKIESKFQKSVIQVKGNILSMVDIEKVFKQYGPFETVYHLASAMPDKSVSDKLTWDTSVTGTENIVTCAVKYKSTSLIFTSTNVTFGIPAELPATEDTPRRPLEIYGKSKVEAEHILEKYKSNINIQIFLCPVITGVGRLGLQSILFEFISDNKNIYLLGNGRNKYQFVDVMDVASALEKASHIKGFDVYVIGGDGVVTLHELCQHIIDYAGKKSKIVSIPQLPAHFLLWLLDRINMSPIGPYQYSMIDRTLYMDTTKIKKKLGWMPQKTNIESFLENYKWYVANKNSFTVIGKGDLSSNRSLPKMKILKLLKYFS